MLKSKKLYLLSCVILAGALGIFPLYAPEYDEAKADVVLGLDEEILDLQVFEQTTLLPLSSPPSAEVLKRPKVLKGPKALKRLKVMVTGYSSSVGETDEDPFVTASGKQVKDGIVANNLLAFGARIRLPEMFGDKIFVVEDRMHWRKGYYHIDIWFPSQEKALAFGAKLSTMEILND